MRLNSLAKVYQNSLQRSNYHPDIGSIGNTIQDNAGNTFGFIAPAPFFRNDGSRYSTNDAKAEHSHILSGDAAFVHRLYSNGTFANSPTLNFFDIHDKTYHTAYYYVTEEIDSPYHTFYLNISRSEHAGKHPEGSTPPYHDKAYIDRYEETYHYGTATIDFYLLGGPAFNPYTKKWDILFAPAINVSRSNDLNYPDFPNQRLVPYEGSWQLCNSQYYYSSVITTYHWAENNLIRLNDDLTSFVPYGRSIYSFNEEPTNPLFSYFIDANLQPSQMGNWGSQMSNPGSYTGTIQYDVDI